MTVKDFGNCVLRCVVISFNVRDQLIPKFFIGNDLKMYYIHYINNGYNEGRIATGYDENQKAVTVLDGVDYSDIYDFEYYQNRYPALKRAFGDDEISTLEHFVVYGIAEGRVAKETDFNLYQYVVNYPGLRKAFGYNFVDYYKHYQKYGKAEGRTAVGNATVQDAKDAIADTH